MVARPFLENNFLITVVHGNPEDPESWVKMGKP